MIPGKVPKSETHTQTTALVIFNSLSVRILVIIGPDNGQVHACKQLYHIFFS